MDMAVEGHMDRGNIFDVWTNGAIFEYLGSNVKVSEVITLSLKKILNI